MRSLAISTALGTHCCGLEAFVRTRDLVFYLFIIAQRPKARHLKCWLQKTMLTMACQSLSWEWKRKRQHHNDVDHHHHHHVGMAYEYMYKTVFVDSFIQWEKKNGLIGKNSVLYGCIFSRSWSLWSGTFPTNLSRYTNCKYLAIVVELERTKDIL